MSDLDIFFEEQMKDDKFKAEFNALSPKYELVREIIKERTAQNLTQKEFAEKIGVKQSNISRLESGNYNPSFDFLIKVAKGLGKELHIAFR
ncbi:MAG: helix-turn-helix transcriptional regulator [Clostridium butyricum]|nr:helix-turn-helix transcriptional regulator [Clostridium butyricum]